MRLIAPVVMSAAGLVLLCGTAACSTAAAAAPAAATAPAPATAAPSSSPAAASQGPTSADSAQSPTAAADSADPKLGTCVAFITSYDTTVPCQPGKYKIAAILTPTGDSVTDAKACRDNPEAGRYATVWPLHTAGGKLLCLAYLS